MDRFYYEHTNLIGIPTSYFASPAFNLSPSPIHLNGVMEMNAPLFKAMDTMETSDDVANIFIEHMRVMFELDVKPPEGKRKSFRANFARLIKGWRFDSNRPEGAVMKGWAESRFGLPPLYHAQKITNVNSPAYMAYTAEKMHARFNNNAIYSQFDLLYEYCQYYQRRFGPRTGKYKLFRGANISGDEQEIIEKRGKLLWVTRNNSLVSYTSDVERADEFGGTILQTEVPFEKVLCFPNLLPGLISGDEKEYIVLGGDYISSVVNVLSVSKSRKK
ncbi:MAG: NAD(+)--dinitrogen-reductase ADP-D-ribosyltransferase [Nitrospinae bacterium]|nr:NAD(+)--dinitrogen-reductase ADP-D-ribosyltransferase [Nitrospinota bacterium]